MDNFDPICDIKVTLDCIGTVIPGGQINFIYLSQEGVREDDGETDYANEFEAAVNKSIAQKKVLILDLQQFRVKRSLTWIYPPFTQLRVYSFTNTKIIFDCPQDGVWVIAGTQFSQGDPVPWNFGSGFNKTDELPYSRPSENTDRGWAMKIDDVSDILPGYLLKIQTKQLPVAEHRFSASVGELNRVKAVTSDRAVEFDAKLRHNYRVGPVHTTTIAAVTDTSVTLTDAPLAGITPERLLIKFTNDEERFGQFYDSTTKTLSWPVGGTWDQLPLSEANDGAIIPLPIVGSAITLSADPYVFLFGPIYVTFSGFTIVSANPDVMQRGLNLQMVDGLVMQDFLSEGFKAWGLSLTYCFEPQVRFSQGNLSNHNSLGYTTFWSECRGGLNIGYRSHNNRRMSDSGRICQSIGMLITDFQVTGGWKNDIDIEWEPDEYNYGIGGHGQVLDWTWQNGVVRDVKVGWVCRGGGERLRNVQFEGYMWSICNWGGGEGRSVIGASFDDLVTDHDFLDSLNNAHYLELDRPAFLVVGIAKSSGYPYLGPAEIMDINVKGMKIFAMFDNANELGCEVADWIFHNISWRSIRPPGGNISILMSGGSHGQSYVGFRNFTVRETTVYNRAGAASGGVENPALNSWMRIGQGKFRFRVADNELVTFPVAQSHSGIDPGSIARVRVFPCAPGGGDWFGDILLDDNGFIAQPGLTLGVEAVSAAVVEAGTDPDGTLNFGWVDNYVMWMRNRLGAEVWGVVEFST